MIAFSAIIPASAYTKWTAALPRLCGKVDIISQTKQTTYAANHNVDVSLWKTAGYATKADFLIRAYIGGKWQNVSATKTVYDSNGTVPIPLTNSRATRGVQLMLVGSNGNLSISNVNGAGTVDFH